MKKVIKRYRGFIIMVFILIVVSVINFELGKEAFNRAVFTIQEMILIIPPIFILMGLLDVWVPRETMVRFMGKGSGLKGIILSFLLGSAAAGPLYGAFPIASVFMKKGVTFSNILIFLGAWSTTKIPLVLFEIESLGLKFALTRLAFNIPGILLIAWVLSLAVNQREISDVYEQNLTMQKGKYS